MLFDRAQGGPPSAWQEGVAVTRDLSEATNVGVEIFHSAASCTTPQYTDLGVGYIGEIGALHAVLFSAGRALGRAPPAHAYLAYEWRLGPTR